MTKGWNSVGQTFIDYRSSLIVYKSNSSLQMDVKSLIQSMLSWSEDDLLAVMHCIPLPMVPVSQGQRERD